ncbi:DNA-binding transcriptional LysR family regulator [Sphingomonas sp. SORGH_AS 950]|nr:DNA-binding transcriptional LysR family regulator [Sphingomonas sp. SORGH_AS_0950]
MCKNAHMLDWKDVHAFAILARAGSLSAAARILGVDHVTVGRRIASLEQSLGVTLVERLPRRIGLTSHGEDIAALASKMEEVSHAIERCARGRSEATVVSVRITAPPAVAARLIAPRIAGFHQMHRNVIPILAGVSHHSALDRGEADVAVRLARPRDPDLVTKLIGVMRFGLYATPEIAVKPASEWTFIGYDAALEHTTQQVWLRSLLAGRPIVFQASDLFGQVEAARAGLGAVVLPRFMGDPDPTLVPLRPDTPPPTLDMWLATYPDLRRSHAVRAVMDFLSDAIGAACCITAGQA